MVGTVAKERRKTFSLRPSLSKCVPISTTLITLKLKSGVRSSAESVNPDFRIILDTNPIKC